MDSAFERRKMAFNLYGRHPRFERDRSHRDLEAAGGGRSTVRQEVKEQELRLRIEIRKPWVVPRGAVDGAVHQFAPFLELHERHAATRLEMSSLPPMTIGVMWSTVKSRNGLSCFPQ